MSEFKWKLMPSADEVCIAVQVSSTGQLARQSKPYRPLSRRWSHRGLGGYLILADICAPELPRFKRHVPNRVAFQKTTFGRVAPIAGLGGIQTYRVNGGVMELEALPANSKEKAG
jgi:hypothetical protein